MKHELITAKTQNFDEVASSIEDAMKDLTEPLGIVIAQTLNFNELADTIEEETESSTEIDPIHKEPPLLSPLEGSYKVRMPKERKERKTPKYEDLRQDEKNMVYFLKRGWRNSLKDVNWFIDYLAKRGFSENEIAELSGHHLETLELWKRNKYRPFGPFSTHKAIQKKLIMVCLIEGRLGEKDE